MCKQGLEIKCISLRGLFLLQQSAFSHDAYISPHEYDSKPLFCQKEKCKPGRNYQAGGQSCLFSKSAVVIICCLAVLYWERSCVSMLEVFVQSSDIFRCS